MVTLIAPNWRDDLPDRQRVALEHAQDYTVLFSDAGAPGHSHMTLIHALAQIIDAGAYCAPSILPADRSGLAADLFATIAGSLGFRVTNLSIHLSSSLPIDGYDSYLVAFLIEHDEIDVGDALITEVRCPKDAKRPEQLIAGLLTAAIMSFEREEK